MPGDIRDILRATTGLKLLVDQPTLEEEINAALLRHSTRVDLSPAKLSAKKKHRQRLHAAVRNLRALADEGATRELLDELSWYPFVSVVLDDRTEDEIGSLPLTELLGALDSFDTALSNRVYRDSGGETNLPEIPYFPELIGNLWIIYRESFEPLNGRGPARAFDTFARAVLGGAEIKPVNGAPFAPTAIDDALGAYREHSAQT